jgi:isopentenyl-diphosphate delta-isomerase
MVLYGHNCSQEDLMKQDFVICVNEFDEIVGTGASKLEAHSITPENPKGICHRAFSVFLFNSKNELLVTQRSAEKITFPGIWSNSCCSHPLYHMTPDEVCNDENVPSGTGVKRAAKRKMKHELGLSICEYQVITRFYYFAKYDDKLCEHELDYILFCKSDDSPQLNHEEMSDFQFVAKEDLISFMETVEFSPWFKKLLAIKGLDWLFRQNHDFDNVIY